MKDGKPPEFEPKENLILGSSQLGVVPQLVISAYAVLPTETKTS